MEKYWDSVERYFGEGGGIVWRGFGESVKRMWKE